MMTVSTRQSPTIFNILVVCLALMIVMPSLPFKFTLQQTAFSVLAMSSLLLAVYSICKLLKKDNPKQQKIKFLELLFIAFLCYVALQLIPISKNTVELISPAMNQLWNSSAYGLSGKATLSADITGTFSFLVTWFSYLVLLILLLRLVVEKWQFALIASVLFLLGIYQVVFDEATKFLGYEYISATQTDGHSYRLTGTFVNSNNVSALINLSIAAGLCLLILLVRKVKQSKPGLQKLVVLFIVAGEVILLYGCIKAGSAGGLLSLVLAVALVIFLLLVNKFSFKILAGLSIFILVLLLVLTFLGSRELNIIELTQNLSLSGRPVLWMDVITMWRDFPLFGVGAGAFEWTFPNYKGDGVTPLRVFTAHSGYLHLLVELGLIGVSILLFIFLGYFFKVISLFKHSDLKTYLICSLLIGVFAFLIQETVESNLQIPAVAIPFFGLFSLSLVIRNINFEQ